MKTTLTTSWRGYPYALGTPVLFKEVVDEEVDGNSGHQLYRIYQVLNDMVSQLITLRWSDCLESLKSRFDRVRYQTPKVPTIGVAGRPRFHITPDQLSVFHFLRYPICWVYPG